ncbi:MULTISPECIES: DUF6612 family protein [Gemella]|uniref:DUF6612 family protein n=1 Tax=Gemella TaxID=1378 RepID=UPI0007683034|nr:MULTISPECIES: DUF6612 family protein [Gemella]AME08944.1 hypothetical protein AXE85_01555 [Gemella sp. oral taxon 928]AXI26515.1 hypothetical protein CG018_03325 [Gemella sp. ND 6198]
MKKSIKRILFLFTTMLLTVVLAACSSGGGGTKTISSQEAVDKYVEAAKNIKSAKFTSDINVKMTNNNTTREVIMKMNGSVATEPLSLLVDSESKIATQSQKMSIYLKDNVLYAKQGSQTNWSKLPISGTFQKQIESLKNVGNTEDALNYYKNNANDFKVEAQGDNYVLSYSGNDEKFKELLKTSVKTTGQNISNLDSVDIKNASFKITVKKSDFQPVTSELSVEISQKDKPENNYKMDIKYTFSDINSTTVPTPEGIK